MAGVLTGPVAETLARTDVIPVATASPDGVPNVVPMRFVRVVDDETVVVADNYMGKGAANLRRNPWLALTVWDRESKRAYQIKGRAEVLTSGPLFDETAAWVASLKPELRTRAAVRVTVTNVFVCQPGPDLGTDLFAD
jgi:predicted pyridoxine 5'-phosphate oxidase superfamily flavin-nucleotide-binding protein